jgi:hypothetical protein
MIGIDTRFASCAAIADGRSQNAARFRARFFPTRATGGHFVGDARIAKQEHRADVRNLPVSNSSVTFVSRAVCDSHRSGLIEDHNFSAGSRRCALARATSIGPRAATALEVAAGCGW